nr:hypothetical protein B0A51_03369 [Rachicladosporium sp. CCFEE 5018]
MSRRVHFTIDTNMEPNPSRGNPRTPYPYPQSSTPSSSLHTIPEDTETREQLNDWLQVQAASQHHYAEQLALSPEADPSADRTDTEVAMTLLELSTLAPGQSKLPASEAGMSFLKRTVSARLLEELVKAGVINPPASAVGMASLKRAISTRLLEELIKAGVVVPPTSTHPKHGLSSPGPSPLVSSSGSDCDECDTSVTSDDSEQDVTAEAFAADDAMPPSGAWTLTHRDEPHPFPRPFDLPASVSNPPTLDQGVNVVDVKSYPPDDQWFGTQPNGSCGST